MFTKALLGLAGVLHGGSAAPNSNSEYLAQFFVSACLDGRAVLPEGSREVSRVEADMPPSRTLKNARYYRLQVGTATFLRMAEVDGDVNGITRFCEVRSHRINLSRAWTIVAPAVDPRIDRRPTNNVDLYEIDYPSQRFRILMHQQFLLVQTYSADAAAKQMKLLKNPSEPRVVRTDLPY